MPGSWDSVTLLSLFLALLECALYSPYCRTSLAPLLKHGPLGSLLYLPVLQQHLYFCTLKFGCLPPLWALRIIQLTVTLWFFWLKRLSMQISWALPLGAPSSPVFCPAHFSCLHNSDLCLFYSARLLVFLGSSFLCYSLESASRQKVRAMSRFTLFIYLFLGFIVLGSLLFNACKHLYLVF